MTTGQETIVLEVISGPLDGTIYSIHTTGVSVGVTEEDDLCLPGYGDLADVDLHLAWVAPGSVTVTASTVLRLNGEKAGESVRAAAGDTLAIGTAEFALVVVETAGDHELGGREPGGSEGADRDAGRASVRCRRCGALNSPQAPWCGSCGRDL